MHATLTMAFLLRVRLVGATNSQFGDAPPSSAKERLNICFFPLLTCKRKNTARLHVCMYTCAHFTSCHNQGCTHQYSQFISAAPALLAYGLGLFFKLIRWLEVVFLEVFCSYVSGNMRCVYYTLHAKAAFIYMWQVCICLHIGTLSVGGQMPAHQTQDI